MPLRSEEVLERLIVATAEAQTATREIHDTLRTWKTNRADLERRLDREIERLVGDLAAEIRSRLHREAGEMIARLDREWRSVLGLPDP